MERFIRNSILLALRRLLGEGFVPVAVSNRHVHLDQKTVEALFGLQDRKAR
jgi:propanediol utilization protein